MYDTSLPDSAGGKSSCLKLRQLQEMQQLQLKGTEASWDQLLLRQHLQWQELPEEERGWLG